MIDPTFSGTLIYRAKPAPERIVPSCVEALENYQQADMDGIMVLVSRQAIHETIDAYWARVGTCEALTAERDALAAELRDARMSELSALGQACDAYEQQQALAAEVERLREALEPFAAIADELDEDDCGRVGDEVQAPVTAGQCRSARAALEEGKDG